MRNKSVAVLDIRSSEICATIGEKGVNNTFIIKNKYSCAYDGYADGELLDAGSFSAAVEETVGNVLSASGNSVKEFYIGVPDELCEVELVDKVISFPATQRISDRHVDNLIALSMPENDERYTVVKHSPIYFVLSDNRRVIYPNGSLSDSLRGRVSFYKCRTAFIGCVTRAFAKFRTVRKFHWIPQCYANGMYLIEPETRDSYAVLFDLGFISSSYSVICGNGIVFNQAFSVGIGHIAVLLMNEKNIPYEVALEFLGKVNLNAKEKLSTVEECKFEGVLYRFSTSELRETIREGLDGICEAIEECRQAYTGKDLTGKPLYFTGEGVKLIRGTAEHISSRLVTAVEIAKPKVPYYDKPQFSSLFSLLAAALGE